MVKKELIVSAIENGTVIDHIVSSEVFRVMRLLNLEKCEETVYMGSNLESQKLGKKGIIKVANRFFAPEEINKIALVSPNATIIEIRNFEVTKKTKVELPQTVKGIVKCMNPNCITNHEVIEVHFIRKNNICFQFLQTNGRCRETLKLDDKTPRELPHVHFLLSTYKFLT